MIKAKKQARAAKAPNDTKGTYTFRVSPIMLAGIRRQAALEDRRAGEWLRETIRAALASKTAVAPSQGTYEPLGDPGEA